MTAARSGWAAPSGSTDVPRYRSSHGRTDPAAGHARRLGDQPAVAAVPWVVAGPRRPPQPHLAVGRGRGPAAGLRVHAGRRAGRGRPDRPQPLGIGVPERAKGARLDRDRRPGLAPDDRSGRGGKGRRGVVALHGFEWSHAAYGHMNVWNSRGFTDPLRTAPTMGRFWRWLEHGREDELAGFNHPGTGRLRFGGFGYRPALAQRLVSLELFNKLDEYLFKDTDRGGQSPLCQCLDAGWR